VLSLSQLARPPLFLYEPGLDNNTNNHGLFRRRQRCGLGYGAPIGVIIIAFGVVVVVLCCCRCRPLYLCPLTPTPQSPTTSCSSSSPCYYHHTRFYGNCWIRSVSRVTQDTCIDDFSDSVLSGSRSVVTCSFSLAPSLLPPSPPPSLPVSLSVSLPPLHFHPPVFCTEVVGVKSERDEE
jgi:hypothetical protein